MGYWGMERNVIWMCGSSDLRRRDTESDRERCREVYGCKEKREMRDGIVLGSFGDRFAGWRRKRR